LIITVAVDAVDDDDADDVEDSSASLTTQMHEPFIASTGTNPTGQNASIGVHVTFDTVG
jgi:hypothetical protein